MVNALKVNDYLLACKSEPFEKIEQLLANDPSLFHAHENRHAGLEASFNNVDRRVVGHLMNLGVAQYGDDYHLHTDRLGRKAIHGFAGLGDQDLLVRALDSGVSIEAANVDGETLLHFAATHGQDDIVDLLIDRGANVHALDLSDRSVLHKAKNARSINALLGAGADVHIKDIWGYTPLMILVKNANKNFQLLIDAGSDVNARIKKNNSAALHFMLDDYTIIRSLIEAGANIHATDDDESTPLHCQAMFGAFKACQLLIDAGANINALSKNGNTPLFDASESEPKIDVIMLLLESGADTSIRDNIGNTFVSIAESNKDVEAAHNTFLAKQAMKSVINHHRPVHTHPN